MKTILLLILLLLPVGAEGAHSLFVYGDSKVSTGAFLGSQYTDVLTNYWPFTEASFRVSRGGYGVVQCGGGGCFTNVIDDDLAATTGTPDSVLLNIGTNDPGMISTNDGRFANNYGLILDAIHTKWPNIRIGLARPWSTQATMSFWDQEAGVLSAFVAARSYCFLGPDERIYLENGDNGATYTSDGIHYTTTGHALTATNWAGTITFPHYIKSSSNGKILLNGRIIVR